MSISTHLISVIRLKGAKLNKISLLSSRNTVFPKKCKYVINKYHVYMTDICILGHRIWKRNNHPLGNDREVIQGKREWCWVTRGIYVIKWLILELLWCQTKEKEDIEAKSILNKNVIVNFMCQTGQAMVLRCSQTPVWIWSWKYFLKDVINIQITRSRLKQITPSMLWMGLTEIS